MAVPASTDAVLDTTRSVRSGDTMTPRLLVITASGEMYGSDRSLLNALDALTKHFDVTIAFPSDGPGVEAAQRQGAHTLVLPDFALRRRNFRSPSALRGWITRVRSSKRSLDELHTAQPFAMIYSNTFAAAIGPLLRRSWKCRHVTHVRECPLEPRWQIKTLCAIADHNSDAVLCNSYYTEGLLAQVRPHIATKTVVVHNGIELPDASHVVVPRAVGALRISCVGRIHPKKGQGVLLDAAAIARQAGRVWELHFYGDALPEHQELADALRAQVAASELTDQVTWHGFVEGTDRYSHCDVAVVPSVYPEEFSLVCAEAQAMGLPVIATGPGGPSEILQDGSTGFVVPPRNAQALYAALVRLDDDREMAARFGALGNQVVRAKFSREAYSNSIVAALKSRLT